MTPYMLEKMLEERHKDMVQEAQRLRLIAAYEKHTRPKRTRALFILGEKLIRAGEKLQQRYGERVELPAG